MAGALEGLLVVGLEQAVAAPLCTCRLADAGARVIKIERAEGDFARHYDAVAQGESAYFVWLNRGKESVVLDLKDRSDAAVLGNLLDQADVLVQNLKPGALGRAGFPIADLRARNPRLIVCSISGYGTEGPYRDRKAYDLLVQAESGLASVTGTPEEAGRVGVSVTDIATGLNAHGAILEALLARERSGCGQEIEVSLFDAMADWMTVPLLHFDYGGAAPPRVGLRHPSIAPYGVFRTRDGRAVLLSIQNEREWRVFCAEVLGDGALASDPRFAGNGQRVANRPELDRLVQDAFGALAHDELAARLTRSAIAFGDLNSIADLSRHPHLRRIAVEAPGGLVELPAPPAIKRGEAQGRAAVPALGEHTEMIKREFAPPARPRDNES
jgi:crotonobetainyl-CoA:carnitine CoA-transferase CaiB-like acyl-CoA transferase